MEKVGFTIKNQHAGIEGSGVKISPIPSESAVPLIMQNGMSAPRVSPCFISSSCVIPKEKS